MTRLNKSFLQFVHVSNSSIFWKDGSSNSPPPNTHLQAQRLPQEPLTSLHRPLLLQLPIKHAEYSGRDNKQFHLGDVTPNARTRSSTKRNKGGLLARREAGGVPALRDKVVGVRAPDFLGVVDCVARDRENIAGLEHVAADLDGGSALGDLAGKTHG